MRFGTSFFDRTIYRKTLTRFWPLWVTNLVLWLIILPISGLFALDPDRTAGDGVAFSLLRFARNTGAIIQDGGVIVALLAGLVVAMAVCSHLYNHRSANFMGALPARREGTFFSTWLAGLTMLLGPNVVVFLLTALVEGAGGCLLWKPLLFWLAALCAMELFFFSFAVCIGQFAGHILALPVFYGVFNAFAAALTGMLNWVVECFFYGYDGSIGGEWVKWLTPVWAFFDMDCRVVTREMVGDQMITTEHLETTLENLWIAGVYAIAAVVLTVCALLLYRRRHMETAGDVVAVKAMRPVFKYGVAICAGLSLGYVMYTILGLSLLGLAFSVVLWGVVGYFAAQMMLDKTFRVFKKWKGAVAVVAAFLLMFAVVAFDLTGFERRVPAADRVESVTISWLNSLPYDTGCDLHQETFDEREVIEAAIALHQGIVEVGEDGEANGRWTSFRVSYRLTSGRVLSRKYAFNAGETLAPLAQAIIDQKAVRHQTYYLDEVEQIRAQGATLAWAEEDLDGATVGGWKGETAMALWNAVMTDFEAGRIGVHVLEAFYALNETESDPMPEGSHAITFCWELPGEDSFITEWKKQIRFAIPDTARETRKALERLSDAETTEKTVEDILAGN